MNIELLIPLAAALCTFIIGVMVLVGQSLRKQLPDARIRSRVQGEFQLTDDQKRAKTVEEQFFTVEKEERAWSKWIEPKLTRLQTVAGKNGIKIIVAMVFASLLESLIGAQILPIPKWIRILSVIIETPLAVMWVYKFLVNRFKTRFLEAFPDAIDTIVRAVRAGVPVTQVIGVVAAESPAPLSEEFKIMADSLSVGRDLNEVLEVATQRIGISDFSFFCVCLTLQRETGGQLGETLENLSGIIRSRKELRQKSKALTGEARITTKILAAIPIVVMIAMYFLNREYLLILFRTEQGHKLLTIAAASMLFGMAFINKMSKLDTTR